MADGNQGEMAERFNAAVLKTVVQQWTGGSNPSLSAKKPVPNFRNGLFALCNIMMRPDARVSS
jgi:hypothetical protein